MPRAQKGQRFGGRKKGTPNKISGDLRRAMVESLDELGGVDFLVRMGRRKNNAAYLSLLGRCIPKDVSVDTTGALTVTWAVPTKKGESDAVG